MQTTTRQPGFTIVELLIVIVVIGILAAITIVAYNGVQNRARDTTAISDLTNGAQRILAGQAIAGVYPTTIEANSSADYKIKLASGNYNLVSYCVSDTGFVIAAESKSGNKYYAKDNTPVIQNNSLNILNPCVGLGVQNANGTPANKIFFGMSPTSCSTEGGTCTFSGSADIAYGSLAQGKFNALENQTSPLTCNNTTFGDPASGFTKSCYVLSY